MLDSHFNKNLPCSIAIKVTSDNPEDAEIIELVIVPLTVKFEPRQDVMPLSILIRPSSLDVEHNAFRRVRYDYPTYIVARKPEMRRAMDSGLTYEDAVNLMEKWFESLDLKEHKKIMPIGYGYGYVMSFLIRWMGYLAYEEMFDWHYRDILSLVSYDQDRWALRNIETKWRKLDLRSVLTLSTPDASTQIECMSQAIDQTKLYRSFLDQI